MNRQWPRYHELHEDSEPAPMAPMPELLQKTGTACGNDCLICHGTRISHYTSKKHNGVVYEIAVRCTCSPMEEK